MSLSEILPIDILASIFRYTPAECIILHTMSKTLRKAVLKTGYSITMMHLFYINKYGYMIGSTFEFAKYGDRLIEYNKYFTSDFSCFIYDKGEYIKYGDIRSLKKYMQKCLENNNMMALVNIPVSMGESKEYVSEMIKYRAKQIPEKDLLYMLSFNESLNKIIVHRLLYYRFTNGLALSEHEMNFIKSNFQPSYVYHMMLTGFELPSYEIIFQSNIFLECFIKNDNAELLDKLVKTYDFNLKNNGEYIIHLTLLYDSVKVYEYIYSKKIITNKVMQDSFNIPKIYKYIVDNWDKYNGEKYPYDSKMNSELFLSKFSGMLTSYYMVDLYVPNSRIMKYIEMIKIIYPKTFMLGKELAEYTLQITDLYNITLLTPHFDPFVNKLARTLYKGITLS